MMIIIPIELYLIDLLTSISPNILNTIETPLPGGPSLISELRMLLDSDNFRASNQ